MANLGTVAFIIQGSTPFFCGSPFTADRTGILVDVSVTSQTPFAYAYIYRNAVAVWPPISTDGTGVLRWTGLNPSYSNPYTIYTADPATKLATGESWRADVATNGVVTLTQLFSSQRAVAVAFA